MELTLSFMTQDTESTVRINPFTKRGKMFMFCKTYSQTVNRLNTMASSACIDVLSCVTILSNHLVYDQTPAKVRHWPQLYLAVINKCLHGNMLSCDAVHHGKHYTCYQHHVSVTVNISISWTINIDATSPLPPTIQKWSQDIVGYKCSPIMMTMSFHRIK